MSITPARMEEAASDTSRRHIVPLSGGKDSTALSIHLSQTYPALDFEFVFCDTGAELPETYEYLDRLEHVLGHPVTRIGESNPCSLIENQVSGH
jgi:3'-phosphoadenosine 5'-phosphosulfate sulfotransferase (PAPS reductase)/FAD synthetase